MAQSMMQPLSSASDPPTHIPPPFHRSQTQHHRLPATSAPANPSVLTQSNGPRLNDLFDAIRAEVENAGRSGDEWKLQRDDLEQKRQLVLPRAFALADGTVQAQVGELAMIRQTLYELEAAHAKIREQYVQPARRVLGGCWRSYLDTRPRLRVCEESLRGEAVRQSTQMGHLPNCPEKGSDPPILHLPLL